MADPLSKFLCSLCLDVWTHPVSTPCEHIYCKTCINDYWDTKDATTATPASLVTGKRSRVFRCPLCDRHFSERPPLLVNYLISNVADYMRESKQQRQTSSPNPEPAEPDEVSCDVCTETKLRALKSCLVCLTSYCDTHLEPHHSVLGLQRHKLIDPVKNLEDNLCKEHDIAVSQLEKMRMIQRYAVHVTLDPDTANPYLILSEDKKQVCGGDERRNVPDNSERFSFCECVLGSQSFSSGSRSYYEVQVGGKTEWDVGVARESINRKEMIKPDPDNGYWTIGLRRRTHFPSIHASLILPYVRENIQKVGVFVDYDEGLVFFYDVDAGVHIFSFTGYTFAERLYPFFCPYLDYCPNNSAPLIISPVNHTD